MTNQVRPLTGQRGHLLARWIQGHGQEVQQHKPVLFKLRHTQLYKLLAVLQNTSLHYTQSIHQLRLNLLYYLIPQSTAVKHLLPRTNITICQKKTFNQLWKTNSRRKDIIKRLHQLCILLHFISYCAENKNVTYMIIIHKNACFNNCWS